jgi:hypothetical protein
MTAQEELESWLLRAGLYQTLALKTSVAMDLANLLKSVQLRIDCYCPACRKESVFSLPRMIPAFHIIPQRIDSYGQPSTHEQVLEYLGTHLHEVIFRCARGSAHTLTFHLDVIESDDHSQIIFRKVGQFPSHFELVSQELQRYSKVLDDIDLRELKSAEVCSSHGYHVAAFVYLRRVFERRLEVAHVAARSDSEWDEGSYDKKKLRMDERIEALKDHLPKFLVENRKLYGILSLGAHELSEQQCAEGYQAVRVAITLILDEEIERKDRAAKITSASTSLQKLQQKLEASKG